MSSNTNQDFNHKSKIRQLDPSGVPNSTQIRLAGNQYICFRAQQEPRLQRKGKDSTELVMTRK